MSALSKLSTDSLGIKLSLLCATTTVCAFSLYLLLKSKYNPYEEERIAKAAMESRYTRIRIKVEQRKCGYIIGKDGTAIKSIAKDYGVQLHFVDDQCGDKTERTLEICGQREKVNKAEIHVQKILKSIPEITKKTIHVPKKSVGSVIGKGGCNILRIKQNSHCKIMIQKTPPDSKLNEIELMGTSEQIETAMTMIMDEVKNDSHRRSKGQKHEISNKTPKEERRQELPYRKVFISAVDNPGHFWCQFLDKDDGLTLEDINRKISEFVEFGDSELNCLAVGDLVAGKFEADSKWYRARVNDISESKVDLYFVDYGDTEWVRFPEEVRKLPRSLENYEHQAVQCCLANVEPIGEWSEEACSLFEDLTACAQWKPRYLLEYKDKSGEGYRKVTLFNTLDGNKCIEEELVKEKHAVFKS